MRIHVLEKPVRPIELWNAIDEAVDIGRNRHCDMRKRTQMREQVAGLSGKERQVLRLVAEGKSTKAMAVNVDVSVRAVELRRRSLMEKLDLKSRMDLIRFAILANKTCRRQLSPVPLGDCRIGIDGATTASGTLTASG